MTKTRHFLDTTIVRRRLWPESQAYRKYLDERLDNQRIYINAFVRMEAKRGYIVSLIRFYCFAQAPVIESMTEAIRLWTNNFNPREMQSVVICITHLLENSKLELGNPDHKDRCLKVLADYILRQFHRLNGLFKDTGIEPTHCARDKVKFPGSLLEFEANIRSAFESFEDTKACRDACSVAKFIEKNSDFVKAHNSLKNSSTPSKFKGLIKKSERVIQDPEKNSSCSNCAAIGDILIALQCPDSMQLEHGDRSFEIICPAIGQTQRYHDNPRVQIANTAEKSADSR